MLSVTWARNHQKVSSSKHFSSVLEKVVVNMEPRVKFSKLKMKPKLIGRIFLLQIAMLSVQSKFHSVIPILWEEVPRSVSSMTKTELLSVVKIQYPCDSFVSEATKTWCAEKFEENIFTPLRTACRPRRTKRSSWWSEWVSKPRKNNKSLTIY